MLEKIQNGKIYPNLRIIKTARTKKSINESAIKGFWPLIKEVKPSKDIKSKYRVIQNKITGEIEKKTDYRSHFDRELFDIIIDWTFYYPYNFKLPFAAYLVPKDIEVGERVYLEDLIEDYVGIRWNQGNAYRLEGCEAIWNGKDFDIQYETKKNRMTLIG
jgi:hypothetical protein